MKKLIAENLKELDLEGPLDNAILYLQGLKDLYPDHSNLRIDMDYCYESRYWYLWGDKLETDKVYQARIAKEAAVAAKQEERERQQLELLKQKYEKH